MVNPFKRLLSGIIAVLLLSASACSSEQSSVSETTAPGEAKIEETAAETDILESIGSYNFDGRDFTIICQHTTERPNVAPEEETGDIFYDSVYRRDRAAEERYGITISYVEDTNRVNIKNQITKGVQSQEDIYNIVLTCLSDGFNTLAPNGMLADLRAIDVLCLDEAWWNQSMNEVMTFDNKQFVASGPISLSYYHSAVLTLVNLNMAKNFNLNAEDLYTAVLEGRWTLDMLETLSKNMYADLNNDGKADADDQYGFALCDFSGNALYIGSGETMVQNTGDSIEPTMASERSLTVLDRIHNFCATADVLKTEKLGNDSSGISNKIALFRKGNILFTLSGINMVVTYLRDMEEDYGVLPVPKWDDAQEEYYTLYNPWMPSGFGIPVSCLDTEYAGVISEALARLSYSTVQPNLFEITLKEKATRDENSKEMLNIIINAITVDLNAIFDFGGSSTLLREYAVAQSDKFVSTYEKYTKKIQKDINRLIEQYNKLS